MKRIKTAAKNTIEVMLPWLFLAVLLSYTYARFFLLPYGFSWRSDGIVDQVYVPEREPTIHEGDRLVQVGALPFDTFIRSLRQDLFGGAKPGDVVRIVVERNGQRLPVQWVAPGPSPEQLQDQLLSPWFLSWFLWLAGTATLVLLRPRDMRWFLLGTFNFLVAVWFMTTNGLALYHVWYSALVLRCVVWLLVPVSLHLHWIFPKPLGRLPVWLLATAYAAGLGLAGAQWLELLPSRLYYSGFLLGIIGSLALLLVHAARQPEMRRDLRMILLAAVVAIVPSALLILFRALRGPTPPVAAFALLSLPILAFAYLYAAYRRQLGGLELRVNRVISIYTFVILLGSIAIPILVFVHRLPVRSADQPLMTSVIAMIVVTTASLWGFPKFQSLVEQRMLGIAVPSRELQQTYASHIASSSTFEELTRHLDEEIMPSLLVRQFAFLMLDNGSTRLLLNRGLRDEQIPGETAVAVLTPLVGRHSTRGLVKEKPYSWIRLTLALRVQDELAGFWLFGRRDPDDTYSHAEIPVLQMFADQTAIALSNILQSERLRAMYQADINRHENERLSLARDLHDSVLSALAGMLMNTDIHSLPRGFQEGYQVLTQRLREIVSDLRPPMLSYGLKPAIEELADNLMERSHDTLSIVVDLAADGHRYPADKEQHLFRIAQEACENAVRHSHCKSVTVSGRMDADCVEMSIADDGDGFKLAQDSTQLYDLLGHRHFGLAGMLERAAVIDADIRINSAPGAGTQVFVRWQADRGQVSPPQGVEDSST